MNPVSSILAVAAGGALGASARFGVTVLFRHLFAATTWPWATFTVNLLGCFAGGVILAATTRSPWPDGWRLFLVTGLLGGFTTFSAFGLETASIAADGRPGLAAAYAASSVILGTLAVGLGFLALPR